MVWRRKGQWRAVAWIWSETEREREETAGCRAFETLRSFFWGWGLGFAYPEVGLDLAHGKLKKLAEAYARRVEEYAFERRGVVEEPVDFGQ